MTRQLARRQRRERLAGIVLAALGVAVLIVALYALQGPSGHSTGAGLATTTVTSTPKSSPKPSPKSTPASSATTRPTSRPTTSGATAKLPLVVLNNTRVVGLAQRAKVRFEAGGWTVTSTGNLSNNILSTCAYYDPADAGAAAAARALQTQFPAIKRTAPKFDGLPAGPVVVVLTSDYS